MRAGLLREREGDAFACESCLSVLGEGSSTAGVGAVSADDCRCGPEYYRDAEGMCRDCPTGAKCSGGFAATMSFWPNFWRASPDSDRLHVCEAPRGVSLCQGSAAAARLRDERAKALAVRRRAADGGAGAEAGTDDNGDAGEDLCLPGHAGPLCWECVEGWGKRLGVCEACGSESGALGQSAAFVVLGAALFLLAVYFLVTQNLGRVMEAHWKAAVAAQVALATAAKGGGKRKPEGMNLTMGVVKILVTWLQMASLANSMRAPTGPEMAELLKWEDLGNVRSVPHTGPPLPPGRSPLPLSWLN